MATNTKQISDLTDKLLHDTLMIIDNQIPDTNYRFNFYFSHVLTCTFL